MKRQTCISVFLLFCILLFVQCEKREKGVCLGTISFTEQDLQIIPYLGGESFTLVDSLGDSINYFFQNPLKIMTITWHDPDVYINTQDDLEYADYYYTEWAYIDIDTLNKLSLSLIFTNPFEPTLEKRIEIDISISNSYSDIANFKGWCKFDNGVFYQYQDALLFYDSLYIVDKYFFSVYSLASHATNPDHKPDYITLIFYNINQGIVGIQTANGRVWRLN